MEFIVDLLIESLLICLLIWIFLGITGREVLSHNDLVKLNVAHYSTGTGIFIKDYDAILKEVK